MKHHVILGAFCGADTLCAKFDVTKVQIRGHAGNS